MGNANRLATALIGARRRAADFFWRHPGAAIPLTGAAVLIACGLFVWLLMSHGSGQTEPSSAVLANAATRPSVASADLRLALLGATPTAAPTEAAVEAAAASDSASGSATSSEGSSAPATGSGMRMVIPRIGVNAPVNVRTIGADGQMGVPNGKDDVIWYDFAGWTGMGGYPGAGGNAVFSGHVDYHPHYEAVFWDLHLLQPGDLIEVYLPDGSVVDYSVQWSRQIGPEDDFSAYATQTGEDTITIVTCQGTFNSATHQYDHRLVVRGIRAS